MSKRRPFDTPAKTRSSSPPETDNQGEWARGKSHPQGPSRRSEPRTSERSSSGSEFITPLSATKSSESLGDFREEPRPPLRLIDPDLDEAGGRYIVVFLANFMSRAEISRQRPVIAGEFCQHFFWGDPFLVIVLQSLVPGDVADRSQRRPADLSCTFGNFAGNGTDL